MDLFSFCLISFQLERLRSSSLFYIPTSLRCSASAPTFFIPYLVFFLTASCSSKGFRGMDVLWNPVVGNNASNVGGEGTGRVENDWGWYRSNGEIRFLNISLHLPTVFCLHHPSSELQPLVFSLHIHFQPRSSIFFSDSVTLFFFTAAFFCLRLPFFRLYHPFSASTHHFRSPPPVFTNFSASITVSPFLLLLCPFSASASHLSSLTPIFHPYLPPVFPFSH